MQVAQLPFADAVTMHVIFTRGRDLAEYPFWFRWFRRVWMKPDYGHVSVAFFDPVGGSWVVIDPLFGSLCARSVPSAWSLNDILGTYDDITEVVPVHTWRGFTAAPQLRGLLTCVSVVKATLGIGGWSITPWQLRQQLAAMRATG